MKSPIKLVALLVLMSLFSCSNEELDVIKEHTSDEETFALFEMSEEELQEEERHEQLHSVQMQAYDFPFVAKWHGVKEGGKIGICTCELIAPDWIITAKHCAEKLIRQDPILKRVNIKFRNGTERRAVEAWAVPNGDQAIARLNRSVNNIEPVKLNDVRYPHRFKKFEAIGVGTSGGWHDVRFKAAKARSTNYRLSANTNGLRSGDSGGAWLMDNKNAASAEDYLLMGTIRGGGISIQPRANKAFIMNKIIEFTPDALPTWVSYVNWFNDEKVSTEGD